MVVTCIIGLLASVAIPSFQRLILRARSAERSMMMTNIGQSVQDYVQRGMPGGSLVSADNPLLPPTPYQRPWQRSMAAWTDLTLVVQGNVYYSYSWAIDETAVPFPMISVQALGDLDGDGLVSSKTQTYTKQFGAYYLTGETPPAGQEDDKGPDATF